MKTRHESVNLYKIKSQHLRRPKSEIRRKIWSRFEVDLPLFCPGRNWIYSELFGFNWAETWIYRDLVCKIWQHQRWAGFFPCAFVWLFWCPKQSAWLLILIEYNETFSDLLKASFRSLKASCGQAGRIKSKNQHILHATDFQHLPQ